jgi:RNA polymerase sigma factor (TIGR02999 family)
MARRGQIVNALFRAVANANREGYTAVAASQRFPVFMSDVTRVLSAIEQGDPHAAEKLLPLVYDELRKLAGHRMAQEGAGQTLQATGLVHEAYLRLVEADQSLRWNSRGHFFAAAAEAMRRILIDRAREKLALKRGGEWKRVPLEEVDPPNGTASEDLLALDEALEQLTRLDATAGQLVKFRYFAGLSVEEAAATLNLATATAYRHWAFARAWLHNQVANPPNTAAD